MECCPSRVRPVGPPWGVTAVDILPSAARIPPPVVVRDMVDRGTNLLTRW